MSIPRNMQMEEDRNQRQADAWGHTAADQSFNSAEAVKQREWATEMSNTQYQRAANDASAAGLNRILAIRQGGAGNPSGSSASSHSTGGTGGTPGTASSNFAQAELMESQKDLLLEQKRSEHENIYKRYWEAATEEQKLQTEKHLTEKAKQEASIAGNSAKAYELEGQIDSTTYGKIMRYIDRSIRSITGSGSAYRNFQQ